MCACHGCSADSHWASQEFITAVILGAGLEDWVVTGAGPAVFVGWNLLKKLFLLLPQSSLGSAPGSFWQVALGLAAAAQRRPAELKGKLWAETQMFFTSAKIKIFVLKKEIINLVLLFSLFVFLSCI